MPTTKTYVDLRGRLPDVIYAERNTNVPSTPMGITAVEWYTWYDKGQNDITADITDALAAMGLSYLDGFFEVAADSLWLIKYGFSPIPEPGAEVSMARLAIPTYWGMSSVLWGQGLTAQDKLFADKPNDSETTQVGQAFIAAGGSFSAQVSSTDAGAIDVIDYAVLEIYRLS